MCKAVIKRAAKLAASVDPNWYKIRMVSADNQYGVLVYLNGPLHGDVDITNMVSDILEKRCTKCRQKQEESEDSEACTGGINNPNHKWDFKVKGVVFNLESCATAYLAKINPNGSFVLVSNWGDEKVYTYDELDSELSRDCDDYCWIEGVHYVPFRFPDTIWGLRVFQTVEELLAAYKLWEEEGRIEP